MNDWEPFDRLTLLEKITVVRLLPAELKDEIVQRLLEVGTTKALFISQLILWTTRS